MGKVWKAYLAVAMHQRDKPSKTEDQDSDNPGGWGIYVISDTIISPFVSYYLPF